MKDLIEEFESMKLEHELPNSNNGQYNVGFVKAMNIAINSVKNFSIPDNNKRSKLFVCETCGKLTSKKEDDECYACSHSVDEDWQQINSC